MTSELTRLESLDDLDRWWRRSHRQPVWLFKHSLTCGVSDSALVEFEAFVEAEPAECGYALIEVQNARQLCHEVARRSGVRHESPQALLLSDGTVVWHESHWRIEAGRLHRASAGALRPATVGS